MAGITQSFSLAEKYLPILDEVYKVESLTARLDAANSNIKFIGGNKVELFKTEMDGLANYSRSTGFVTGGVAGTWEALTLAYDRGVSFSVDRMDNEETLDMAFGTLAGEFVRTQAVPEIDAYTFAKICSGVGSSAFVKADITVGTTDCVGLIDTAEQALLEAEVKKDGCILYVSPTMYSGIKAKVTRYLANENGVQRNIEVFDEMPVVVVPQSRFNTAITLNDGTTDFGFTPTAGGYKINFMIVDPKAVVKVAKHVMPRVFNPDENQSADAWKFDYRFYGDTFVEANKKAGIYIHCKNTANT